MNFINWAQEIAEFAHRSQGKKKKKIAKFTNHVLILSIGHKVSHNYIDHELY